MNHFILFVILLLAALFGAACQTATPSPTALPPTDTVEPTEAPTATPTTAPTETPLPTEEPLDETAEPQEQVDAVSMVDGEVLVRVGTQATNARSGPAVTFEIVSRVEAFQELPVIARTDETRPWYLVVLPDGTQGWVSSRAVTLVPEDADVPIAEDVPAAP